MSKYISAGFDQLSNWIAAALGQPAAFLIACATVLIWGITGPFFGYSDTWQLVINTSTTIITFLMVFLLQNTGNRTIEEMHSRLRNLEQLNMELLEELRNTRSTGEKQHD
jgi:low affinity Fe/Cu permease